MTANKKHKRDEPIKESIGISGSFITREGWFKTVKLIPKNVKLIVTPNTTWVKRVEVKTKYDFYYKDKEYKLKNPNLQVNANIKCDNEFLQGGMYTDGNIVWRAINSNTIVNVNMYMPSFTFPVEITLISEPYTPLIVCNTRK